MAGPMGLYQYISDNGVTYKTNLDSSNSTAVGATAAAGTEPDKPLNTKMRYVLAQNPTSGRERKIVVTDPAQAIWTATGGVISLVDYATNTVANHNIRGRIGEKRFSRGRILV